MPLFLFLILTKDDTASWVEYGNPHSTMGQGDLEDFRADFLIEGKAVFDWLDADEIQQVAPFDADGNGNCDAGCGPYTLSRTDSDTATKGTLMGVQIETLTSERFYFIEYRVSSTEESAALITWSDVTSGGNTGYYGNTVRRPSFELKCYL